MLEHNHQGNLLLCKTWAEVHQKEKHDACIHQKHGKTYHAPARLKMMFFQKRKLP